MAITITNQTIGLTNRVLKDTAVTNTAVTNVTGASGSLYLLYANNTANSNAIYIKLYDSVETPVVGTTVPDYVFMIDASSSQQIVMTAGTAFANGISYTAVDSGGTAGTTAPSTPLTVWMVTS